MSDDRHTNFEPKWANGIKLTNMPDEISNIGEPPVMTNPDEYEADVIGGFEHAHPHCNGCHNPLTVENAWMTDGCPCNSELGINSMNETRWRLLMQLQQRDSAEVERLKGYLDRLDGVCIDLAAERRLREAAVAALRKRYQSYLSRMYAMSEPFPNESATKMLCDDLNLDRATFDELGIGDGGHQT